MDRTLRLGSGVCGLSAENGPFKSEALLRDKELKDLESQLPTATFVPALL